MNPGTVTTIIVLGVMTALTITAYVLLIVQDRIRERLKSIAEEEDRVTEDGREDKPRGVHTERN